VTPHTNPPPALYLSLNTVRTHGQRIRRKLGASTRDEAVSAARRLELI
jgi:DNA-binding CsgD family transcriptional regulator